MGELMRKQILFILSTFALLMYPLSLLAQNSTAGDQALTPDFDGDGRVGFPDFLAFAGQFGSRQGMGVMMPDTIWMAMAKLDFPIF